MRPRPNFTCQASLGLEAPHTLCVIAGLDPAIQLAHSGVECLKLDHRVTALRAGPVMTPKMWNDSGVTTNPDVAFGEIA